MKAQRDELAHLALLLETAGYSKESSYISPI